MCRLKNTNFVLVILKSALYVTVIAVELAALSLKSLYFHGVFPRFFHTFLKESHCIIWFFSFPYGYP